MSRESAVGFVMALGNAWGLTLVMAFLGHGLVQFPRALWKSANHRRSLARLEFMAPKVKEQLIDAQADLDEVVAEIKMLQIRPVLDASLSPIIDKLLSSVSIENTPQFSERPVSPSTPITRQYLIKLNYRFKEAMAHRGSSESRWNTLVEKVIHLQDIIHNEQYGSGYLWTPSTDPPSRLRWFSHLQWAWHVKLESLIRRILSISTIILSILILCSEASILYTKADLSPISWFIHRQTLSPTAVEFFTLGLLLYLAACTYSSFMKVRIFRYYLLVPSHTDEKSLLFFAAYFCRIAFPLGYNYLQLIQRNGTSLYLRTEFSRVMGPMNLIPVLGKNFNFYFAIGLVAVCSIVLLRWHGWLAQVFSSDPNMSFADYSDHEADLAEGRELLNIARRQIERSRNRSNSAFVPLWAPRSTSSHADNV